jgi:hypothetical protein
LGYKVWSSGFRVQRLWIRVEGFAAVPLFRGIRKFESLIASQHFRFDVACQCNEEETNDNDDAAGLRFNPEFRVRCYVVLCCELWWCGVVWRFGFDPSKKLKLVWSSEFRVLWTGV